MRLPLALVACLIPLQAGLGQEPPSDKNGAADSPKWNQDDPLLPGWGNRQYNAQTIDPCDFHKFSWCGDPQDQPEERKSPQS